MTPAVLSLLILLVCIVLFAWEPIPTCVTAVLGCIALVVFGVCSFSSAFSGFASETIILFGSMLIVGQTLMETGVAKVIGMRVIAMSKNNERIFLLLSCVVSFLLSMFLANTSVIAMFLALVVGVCATAKEINIRNLMLPIAISAVIGGISTIVGSTQQIVAQGIMKDLYGQGFEFFEFLRITAPIFVVSLIYFMTFGYKQGKRIWGDRPLPEILTEGIEDSNMVAIDKRKAMLSAWIFVAAVLAFLFQISSNAIIACSAALLCLATRCISVKAAQSKPCWNIVVWLAGCLGLAKGLTEAGAADLIAEALVEFCGHLDVFALFAIVRFITMALSTFMSSTTAMLVFLTAALPLCSSLGYNGLAFSIGIIMSASIVFMTPLANGHVGMVIVAGYRFSDYVRCYWPLSIIVYVLIILIVPLWYPLVA